MSDPALKSSATQFVEEITKLVDQDGVSYLDAVLEYCQRKQITPESIAPLIRQLPKLKSKIKGDAEDLFLLNRKKAKRESI